MTSMHGIEDGPPDGGYGWLCVATSFTVNCFTWGIVSVSIAFTMQFNGDCLTQGVLVGLGMGFIYVPTVPVVSQRFL